MPLDPLQYSDSVVRVYERCVDELLVNLAKHFNVSATGNTASWNYEIMMLSKLGAVRRESAAIIAKMVAAGEPAIEEAVRAAMIEAIEENEPDLKKAALNGLLNDVQMDAIDGIQSRLQAFSRQAKSQLNLVNTTMLESTADAFRQGVAAANEIIRQMDAAQDALNVQTGMVHLGTKTHQEALRAAVKAMSDADITGFIDRAGRKWSAEAYVRMNIQTTCGRAANQAVMDRNASYGNDIVWPRTNATARPGCYPWQGQLISMSNVPRDVQDGNGKSRHVYAASETTYGQPAGIWGINCHHFPMNVFIPNFSYVRGEGNKPPQAENDRLYQLTQEQRRLERRVRYAKRDAAMYKAAGDEKAFRRCALRVETATNALKEYVAANPSLVLDTSRTWVYGYNRSVSASAAAANRKTHAAQAAKAAKQAAKAPARQYTNALATSIGKDNYDAMHDLLDKAGVHKLREVWNKYEDGIGIAELEMKGKGTEHCDWTARLHLRLGNNVKGSSYERPYQVIFHEGAHAVDMISGKTISGSAYCHPRNVFSANYKGGIFHKTLKQEALDYVDARAAVIKKAFKDHKGDWKWLADNGYIDSFEYHWFETHGSWLWGKEPKYSKDLAYESVEKELRALDTYAVVDVSDMFEGATKAKIKAGWGHGKSYWSNDWTLSVEAFAEMSSATASNADSLATIKRYFPKSYQIYEEMLDELVK